MFYRRQAIPPSTVANGTSQMFNMRYRPGLEGLKPEPFLRVLVKTTVY